MEDLKKISNYYTQKIEEFGRQARGVDWNSEESQIVRYEQLSKVFGNDIAMKSILDYGCGYGAYYNYLSKHYSKFYYTGFDISEAMIKEAKILFNDKSGVAFTTSEPLDVFDYVIASGLFNVKLDSDSHQWLNYIKSTIQKFKQISKKGFAFNILTMYSDEHLMIDKLYYADPCEIFDYCKRNISRNVSLIHDYNLYEFTIKVIL